MGERGRIDIPSLGAEHLKELFVAVADLVITINEDYVVVGVTDPMKLDNLTLWKWVGRKVVDIVTTDSAPKLSRILREEVSSEASPNRWRHVNFLDARGENLPLLIKFFHFTAGPETTRLIVGRDLRPMEAVQKRFQAALEDLGAQPPAGLRNDRAAAFDAAIAVGELIGVKPYDEIVVEAMSILQQAFFDEALKRAGGDARVAAGLLGLAEDDFLRRLHNQAAN